MCISDTSDDFLGLGIGWSSRWQCDRLGRLMENMRAANNGSGKFRHRYTLNFHSLRLSAGGVEKKVKIIFNLHIQPLVKGEGNDVI